MKKIGRAGILAGAAGVLALGTVGGFAFTASATPTPNTTGQSGSAASTAGFSRTLRTAEQIATSPAARSRLTTLKAATSADTLPPTTAACVAALGVPCYTGDQLAHAYHADAAHETGLTGVGATIMLIDAYGDPAAAQDLAAYDKALGLPAAQLQVLKFGNVPTTPTTPDEVGWAEEAALDIEAAHTMAPGARLILAETAVDETTGTTGFPQIMNAIKQVVSAQRVDAISMSFGVAEQNFPDQSGTPGDYSLLYGLRYGLQAAANRNVTLLGGSGDWGPTAAELNGATTYPYRTAFWPSSDPLVTSVGGTALTLDATGNRTAPDTAWSNDPAWGYAGGGGTSAAFGRPSFQNNVAGVVEDHRGLPDISANASGKSLMDIVSTYQSGGGTGWDEVCGTSEATPLMAGLVADAAALAHRPLGNIGNALYALSATPAIESAAGIADITAGCTTDLGVTGYCATPGYDLATGNGTVSDATRFIIGLAAVSLGVPSERVSTALMRCDGNGCGITTTG